MDPDDALIDLLNGFGCQRGFNGTGNSEKPFLDAAGEPTDSFLQALKHDFTSFSFSDDHRLHQNGRRDARRNFKSDFQEVNNAASDSTVIHSSSEDDERDVQAYSNSDSDEENCDSSSFATTHERNEDQRQNGGKQSELMRNSGALNSSQRHILRGKDVLKLMRSPGISSQHDYTTRGGMVNGHEERSVSRRRSKRKEKVLKRQNLPANHLSTSVSIIEDSGDGVDLKAESDLKIKSLQLRITGQLQTIRVLETQLADTQRSLEMRSLLVKQVESRLRQLEPKEKGTTILCKAKLKEEVKQQSLKAEERGERYKIQIELLQAQLLEEQGRRQRAEERSKALKSYLEKAKLQCSEEEGFNKDLKGSLEALQVKLKRYKRDSREYATEALAQRNLAAERTAELGRQRARTEQAETQLRHAHTDVEKCRDDIRTQKVEIITAQSRTKGLQQEIVLLREREAAQRAAHRLTRLGVSHTQLRPATVLAPENNGRFSSSKNDHDSRRGSSGYLESGDHDDDHFHSRSNDQRAPDSSVQHSKVTVAEREAKGRYQHFSPLMSSTPPRRPHYTLPTSESPLSSSEIGEAVDVVRFKDRSSNNVEVRISKDSRSETQSGIRPFLIPGVRSNDGIDDHKKQLPPRASTGLFRDVADIDPGSRQHGVRKSQRQSNLKPPTLSDASQYFSDSELLHYNKHLISQQINSSSRVKELQKSVNHDDANQSIHLSHLSPSRNRPDAIPVSSNFVLDLANIGNKVRERSCSPNIRISFDKGSGSGSGNSCSGNVPKDSTDTPTDTLCRSGNNPRSSSLDTSVMQRRAEQILDQEETSSSPTPHGQVSTSSQADVARFDRLQNMYKRFTGKGAPISWRDSDSSESD